jgi:phytoene dehydrogenase-like protein
VIADYKFEHPGVQAGLLYLSSMYDLDPEAGGMGFMAPLFVTRLINAALVKGGSHQLSSVLRGEFEANGGGVITSTEVKEILWENGVVVGIRTADGKDIRARSVVSTLNPQQTFRQLCGRERISEELITMADDWDWEDWSLFVGNWGILGDSPRYDGYDPEVNQALSVVMGYNEPDDVLGHVEGLRRGELSEEIRGHGTCLSSFDRLMIPYHMQPPFTPNATLRWECWAPYNINSDTETTWEEQRNSYAQKCFEVWCRYAPNLSEATVMADVHISPADIETRLPNMTQGSIKTGAYTTLQMGYNRPSPECSGYRTPIKGLYLAGASVHPGGMIVLGNGYNAAKVLCEDLGLDVWWSEPEMVSEARRAGYLP